MAWAECDTAFIIGNGVSRKSISIPELSRYGAVYGCNALYRDYKPDHLVAVDLKMVQEIHESGYGYHNKVWTNRHSAIETMTEINILETNLGWSSGPTALWLATTHHYKHIIILGFDYTGTHGHTRFNNVYADTPNYKRSIQTPTYYRNWLKQTVSVIQNNTHVCYWRVIESDGFDPPELKNLINYNTISTENFQKLTKNT